MHDPKWPLLTEKQCKVAEQLLLGSETVAIAQALNCKPRTIKAMLHRMYKAYKITKGIKRVKLAVQLYRQERMWEDYPELYPAIASTPDSSRAL